MRRRTFLKTTLAAVSVAVSGASLGLRAAVAQVLAVRACLETTRGAAARDFGCGQGGEFRASPQRAVRNEPTPATDKRPAARRVFAEKAVWLRCSSVEDPPGIFSLVAPRHPAFSPKTAPLVVSKQALRQRAPGAGGERRSTAKSQRAKQRPQCRQQANCPWSSAH